MYVVSPPFKRGIGQLCTSMFRDLNDLMDLTEL